MLELLPNAHLTQQQLSDVIASHSCEPVVDQVSTKSVESPDSLFRKSAHRAKRFQDPLGDALVRINRSVNPDPCVPPDAASPLNGDSQVVSVPVVVESEECAIPTESVPLANREILPMFDTADSTTVHPESTDSANERRKFPRRRSECRVSIVSRADTEDLTPREIDWILESGHSVGRLQDLGQLGICLLLRKEIPEGTEVILRITNEQIQRNVDMSARILRTQVNRPGLYSIHCQTLRDFTLDELQDLGQQPIPPR